MKARRGAAAPWLVVAALGLAGCGQEADDAASPAVGTGAEGEGEGEGESDGRQPAAAEGEGEGNGGGGDAGDPVDGPPPGPDDGGSFHGGEGEAPGEGEGEGGAQGDRDGDEHGVGEGEGAGGQVVDVNVGQGGAQDFGVFRRILEQGGLPLPETLDDVGFFSEHHTELPPPDCGQVLCLHALLAVAQDMVSGEAFTMLQAGMNARVPEEALQRRPLNLAIAIDTSGSMRAAGKIEFVRLGLELMVDELQPGDEVSVVVYSSEAVVVAEALGDEQREELRGIVRRLGASGGTNLYAGLEAAFELVRTHQQPGRQNRVILLSDGLPTVGLTEDGQILDMARDHTEEGIGLTTIGVGDEFNVTLMRQLAESGSGNFYFIEDGEAVEEVFVEELAYSVTPVATDLRLEVHAGDAYDLGRVFGTKLWVEQGPGGVIEIPSVFVAHRQAHDDQERGRRGGGAAILVDLVPSEGWEAIAELDPNRVARLRLSYLPDGAALREEQTVEVRYDNDPGVLLEGGWFDGAEGEDHAIEKNFVMLNVYLGLLAASEAVEGRDVDAAWLLLSALEVSVAAWNDLNDDEDIAADLVVVRRFLENLAAAGASSPLE